MRPVVSTSMVAVSLLESGMVVVAGRCAHGAQVCGPGTYCRETSCALLPCSRTCATSPIDFTSALALVLAERRSTFVHRLSEPSRQTHVPAGLTAALGSTAHHRPSWNQTFD